MIRANNITRAQAVEALKTTWSSSCSFEEALKHVGYIKSNVSNKVMLGELLIISNQISEVDFLTALENSLINDLPLGTVLIEAGLITKEKLELTLATQKRVTAGEMTAAKAAEFLQQDDSEFGSAAGEPTFAEMPNGGLANFGVAELLIFGKVITHRQATSAQAEAIRTGLPLQQVLLSRQLIDVNILETANRCLLLHGMNTITAEEAILVLHAWLSKRDELIDDVLSRIAQRDLV
jgi:hypothetical protein